MISSFHILNGNRLSSLRSLKKSFRFNQGNLIHGLVGEHHSNGRFWSSSCCSILREKVQSEGKAAADETEDDEGLDVFHDLQLMTKSVSLQLKLTTIVSRSLLDDCESTDEGYSIICTFFDLLSLKESGLLTLVDEVVREP